MDAPLALAFAAGMVATFNPCGFSLLPTYIGAFVTSDTAGSTPTRRIRRALEFSLATSIGFVLVFTAVGLVIETLAAQLQRQLPWITVGIGTLLVVAGVAMVAGWKPTVAIPMLDLGRRRSRWATMFAYGSTFAVASLSCTIGPFLAVTGAAITQSRLEVGATYAVYALGMGVVVLGLSVASAIAHRSIAGRIRRLSAVVSRIGGALMIVAGLYVVWYARWELRVFGGDAATDPLIEAMEAVRASLVGIVERVGPATVAIVVAGVVFAMARSTTRRDEVKEGADQSSAPGQIPPTTDDPSV